MACRILVLGQAPDGSYPEADADGTGSVGVGDLTYLIGYLFYGGYPPELSFFVAPE